MAISSKDIETLWGRYQSEGVSKGVSVSQYFEANGIPYVSTQFYGYKIKYCSFADEYWLIVMFIMPILNKPYMNNNSLCPQSRT